MSELNKPKRRAGRFLAVALCAVLFFSLAVQGQASASTRSFSDVPRDLWCYDTVMAMTNAGLISGYPDGAFKPGNTITRAEAMALLTRLDFPSLYAERHISDVDYGHWAYNSISKAISSGLAEPLVGTGSAFRPSALLTRNEAAIIASRIYGLRDGYSNVSLSRFTDGSSVSGATARMAWQNMINHSIIGGYPDNTLRPNGTITRGEFTKIFNFITIMSHTQMHANLRQSLTDEGLFSPGSNNNQNQNQTNNVDNQNNYRATMRMSNDTLTAGRVSNATVTVTTTNIPSGARLTLSTTNASELTVPSTVTVTNGTGTFTVSTRSNTRAATYKITAEYAGISWDLDVTPVGSDSFAIKDVVVSNTLIAGRNDTSIVTVTTSGVPNNTRLSVSLAAASGLTISNSNEPVLGNRVEYTIRSTSSTPTGRYNFTVKYNGETQVVQIPVDSSSGSNSSDSDVGTVRRLDAQGDLEHGIADSVLVIVTTSGVPDGTRLYPQVTGNLSVDDSTTVNRNRAEFYVRNRTNTATGNYNVTIDYAGDRVSETVRVVAPVPTIKSVTASGQIQEGVEGSFTIEVVTEKAANGDRVTASVPSSSNLSILGSLNITGNKASFEVYSSGTAKAGDYTVTVRIGNSTETVRVTVGAAPYAPLIGITYDNPLRHGVTSNSTVTVDTSGIANGQFLQVAPPDGIVVTGGNSVAVSGNKAVFTVTNLGTTAVGSYTVVVSYGPYTISVSIPVAPTVTLATGFINDDETHVDFSITTSGFAEGEVPINASITGPGFSGTKSFSITDNFGSFSIDSGGVAQPGVYSITFVYGGFNHVSNVTVAART